MFTGLLRQAGVLVVLALSAGCEFNADYLGAKVTCADRADCPEGSRCARAVGRCVPLVAQNDPPALSISEALAPALGRVGSVFTVALSVREDSGLERLPSVEAVFEQGGRFAFSTDDELTATTLRYRWTVPPQVPSGQARLLISAIDRLGNEGQLADGPSLRVDTQAPRPTFAGLLLVPPPGSPRLSVEALGPRGRAVVSFGFEEADLSDAGVRLVARPPVLACTGEPSTAGQQAFTCTLTDAGVGEGPIELTVEGVDKVGNAAPSVLTVVPAFRYDTRPPALEADAGLLHVRVPVGVASTGGQVLQRIFSGAGFTEPGSLVQAFVGESGLELARAEATDAGAVVIELGSPDRARVAVRAVDLAGNLSSTLLVRSVEFRGVPGPTAANAARATVAGAASESLERPELVPFSGQGLQSVDGQGLSVTGRPSWVRRSIQGPPASGLAVDGALAFDEARAQLVVQAATSLLTWNGRDFNRVLVVPSARGNAAIAWDRRRGVTVIYGGTAATADVVELKDTTLRTINRVGVGPSVRTRHVLVWDGEGVQVLGGSDRSGEAFRWQGQRWEPLDAGEMPMNVVAAAFDPRRSEVLAVASADGGSPGTFRYGAAGWGPVVVDGGPPSALGAMVWDTVNDRALFNAVLPDAGAEVWAFGGGWQRLGAGLPTLRSPAASAWATARSEWLALAGPARGDLFAWDADAGWQVRRRFVNEVNLTARQDFAAAWLGSQLVVHGGAFGVTIDDTWRFDGATWAQLGDSPTPLLNHAMVAVPGRNEVLVVGGATSTAGGLQTSTFRIALLSDGGFDPDAGWQALADAGPGIRQKPVLVATGPGEVLLLGGSPDSGGFRYDGGFSAVPDTVFAGRWRQAASVEPGVGVLVSGGAPYGATSPPSDELWVFNGVAQRLNERLPRPRQMHSSVFDESRGEHLVFGGQVAVTAGDNAVNEVLRVKLVDGGTLITLDEPDDPEGDLNPSGRYGQFAAWDDRRQRMLVFGGRNVARTETDLWEYVTAEHRPAVVAFIDTGALEVDGVKRFGLEVNVTAGADSELSGAPVSGVLLDVWNGGRWERLGSLQGSVTQPSTGTFRFESTTPGMAWGALDRLAVRLVPRGTNGTRFAELFVDALELKVTFERP